MRRLLLVLFVAWPLAARADFVNDNGSLPGVKTDKFPLAIGADPTKYIAAADYNALRDALFSERNAVLNGAMLGLAPTPSPTAVTTAHSNYYVFVDGSHNLVFSNNGVPQVICSPTSGCNATAIGAPVGGGLFQSVLFVDSAGDLAQDNTHFNYNPATNVLTVTGLQMDAIAGGLFVNGDGAGASTFIGLFQQNSTLSTALNPTQLPPIISFRGHVWNSTLLSDTTGILSIIDDPITGPVPYDKLIVKTTFGGVNHHMLELSDGTTDPLTNAGLAIWNTASNNPNLSPPSGGLITINNASLPSPTLSGTASGTFLFSTTFPDTIYTHTFLFGDVGSGLVQEIVAGDPSAYNNYYKTFQSNAVNPHGPNDDVTSEGFNCGPGGGVVTAGKAAFCVKSESIFEPDPVGRPGQFQSEWHVASYNLSGLENRVFSILSPQVSTPPSPSPAAGATAQLYVDAYTIDMASNINGNAVTSAVHIGPTITQVSSPDNHVGATFDNSGDTMTLGVSDNSFTTTAQIIMTNVGGGSFDTSQVGRLIDLRNGGNPSFQWDSGQSEMLSPDNNTYINISNGSMLFTAGSVFNIFGMSAGGVAVNQRPFNVLKDSVGTSTRGDQFDAILVRNNTAATGGATQQFSPTIVQTGYGWTGSVSRAVSFETQSQPDGTGAGSWSLLYSSDEANYTQVAAVSSTGAMSVASVGVDASNQHASGIGTGPLLSLLRSTSADGSPTVTGNTLVAYTSISVARTVTGTMCGSATAPCIFVIKDESGSASGVNTISFAPSSGLIDGAASKAVVSAAYGAGRVYCNGTNCFTM